MGERHGDPERMQALRKACGALKVFPLYGVAVLPGTPTPLHVFEPRYRALVRDALRGDRILAVPQLLGAEGLRELHPPVRTIAGAGYIEHHVEHEDGKYDIVLRGLARVRLGDELRSESAYRTFQAEIAEERWPRGGPAVLQDQLESLRQLVLELSTRLPPESGAPALAEAVAQNQGRVGGGGPGGRRGGVGAGGAPGGAGGAGRGPPPGAGGLRGGLGGAAPVAREERAGVSRARGS